MNQENAEETVIALERAVLERWCKGDPFGYSENAAADITYFDHITKTRVDGIAAVKGHLGQFEGKVDVASSKMPNPKVRLHGNIAILTFNWETYSSDGKPTSRWNATEIYRRNDDQWKYIHMHWSQITAP